MRDKREELWTLLEYSTPDLVIESKTWLLPLIYEREVQLENFVTITKKHLN